MININKQSMNVTARNTVNARTNDLTKLHINPIHEFACDQNLTDLFVPTYSYIISTSPGKL